MTVVAAVATLSGACKVAEGLGGAIETLLEPSALAAAGPHAAYAALACYHMLCGAPAPASAKLAASALAAMALQNASLARSTAVTLLQRSTKESPQTAMAVIHALLGFVQALPDIPGTGGPPPAAGEAPIVRATHRSVCGGEAVCAGCAGLSEAHTSHCRGSHCSGQPRCGTRAAAAAVEHVPGRSCSPRCGGQLESVARQQGFLVQAPPHLPVRRSEPTRLTSQFALRL